MKPNQKIFNVTVDKLDWKVIASIDIDRVVRGGLEESSSLQKVLRGIAFCSLEEEFPDVVIEAGISKVFRLSQLLIQYLLHSQERLTDAVTTLQQNNQLLRKECVRLEEKVESVEADAEKLRAECRRRREMIQVQQDFLYRRKDPKDFQKCHFCPKTFVNNSFLQSHMRRRHQGEQEAALTLERNENDKDHHSATSNQRETKSDRQEEAEVLYQLVRSLKDEIREIQKQTLEMKPSSLEASEEIRMMVNRQQRELEVVREQVKNRAQDHIAAEAKLVSQERFWQARLQSVMTEHENNLAQLRLEVTEARTAAAVAQQSLDKHIRQDKESDTGELEKMPPPTEPQRIQRRQRPFETSGPQLQLEHVRKEEEIPEARQQKEDLGGHRGRSRHLEQRRPPPEEEVDGSHYRLDNGHHNIGRSRGFYENVVLSRSMEMFSNLRENEYVSMRSLVDTIGQHPSVEDLVEANPSFLRRYRQEARGDLQERLDNILPIGSTTNGGISDQEFVGAIKRLKEERKSIPHSKLFLTTRKKCRAELDQLTGGGDSEANFFRGRRMTSLRNSLIRGWRRRHRTKARRSEEIGGGRGGRDSPGGHFLPGEKEKVVEISSRTREREKNKMIIQNEYVEMPVETCKAVDEEKALIHVNEDHGRGESGGGNIYGDSSNTSTSSFSSASVEECVDIPVARNAIGALAKPMPAPRKVPPPRPAFTEKAITINAYRDVYDQEPAAISSFSSSSSAKQVLKDANEDSEISEIVARHGAENLAQDSDISTDGTSSTTSNEEDTEKVEEHNEEDSKEVKEHDLVEELDEDEDTCEEQSSKWDSEFSFSQQSDDPGRGRPGRSHSVDLSAAVDQLLEEFASFPKHQQEMKLKSTLPGSEVELQLHSRVSDGRPGLNTTKKSSLNLTEEMKKPTLVRINSWDESEEDEEK